MKICDGFKIYDVDTALLFDNSKFGSFEFSKSTTSKDEVELLSYADGKTNNGNCLDKSGITIEESVLSWNKVESEALVMTL